MTDENLFDRINNNYDNFTKLEKKVANFVLNNAPNILYTSITDLAEMCGVGDTTVFRFCKTLKLNGYQDFKMLVAQSLASKNTISDNSYINVNDSDDCHSVMSKALNYNISALKETFKLFDEDSLNKVVSLLSNARRIVTFGMGSSAIAALFAQQKFMRILPNVEFNSDCHMQYMRASLLDKQDLAIAFSYSGSSKDTIEIIKIAKTTGCNTVGITSHPNSPLAKYCDIVLKCGSKEGPLEGGALPTTLSQLFIVDALYQLYFLENYDVSKNNKMLTSQSISSKLL